MNEKQKQAYKDCYNHGYYPALAEPETDKKPACVYCGSTVHDMAYKTVCDQGRVFMCINPSQCLKRIITSLTSLTLKGAKQ